MDRAEHVMSPMRFHGYLRWLGASWELHDHEQIAFAYHALRRDGR